MELNQKVQVRITYLQQKLYSCSLAGAATPHLWSLLKSQAYLLNFSHSGIYFIIIISTTNMSFFQSFSFFFSLYFMFFSLHLLILSIFVPPQLSFLFLYLNCYCFKSRTVTVQLSCLDLRLLLSNRFCPTVTVLNCYCIEPLLSRHWTVTVLS